MKNICKNILVIGIIFLFFSVGISSGISIDAKLKVSYNESNECRGCQDMSVSAFAKPLSRG